MRKKNVFLTLLLLISLSILPSQVYPYSKETHPLITKYALGWNEDTKQYDFSKAELMYQALRAIGIDIEKQEEQEDIAAKIEEGSKEEDNPPPAFRFRNHFYDPIDGKGLYDKMFWIIPLTGKPSLSWGKDDSDNNWSWVKARDYYFKALTLPEEEDRDEYLKKTFRALGQVIHLIQDKSVPAHTRNDAHPPGNKDMYEIYWKTEPLSIETYPAIYFDKFDKYWDTDTGGGLAEFTNHNFLSRDTIFRHYPHPSRDECIVKTEGILDPDGKTRHYLSSNMVERLVAVSYLGVNPDGSPNYEVGNLVDHVNDYCHWEYGGFLLPRAAGYSAGLLNYFFRGKLEEGYLNLGVINKSGERMTGTLSLYWDDKNGNRSKVDEAEWSVNLAPGEPTYPTYTLPDNAVRCIWVFNGTLGNELNTAVIGKVTTRPPKYGMLTKWGTICTKMEHFGDPVEDWYPGEPVWEFPHGPEYGPEWEWQPPEYLLSTGYRENFVIMGWDGYCYEGTGPQNELEIYLAHSLIKRAIWSFSTIQFREEDYDHFLLQGYLKSGSPTGCVDGYPAGIVTIYRTDTTKGWNYVWDNDSDIIFSQEAPTDSTYYSVEIPIEKINFDGTTDFVLKLNDESGEDWPGLDEWKSYGSCGNEFGYADVLLGLDQRPWIAYEGYLPRWELTGIKK